MDMYQDAQRLTLESLGIVLTPAQQILFDSEARHKIGMGGERAGKSHTAATYLTSRHMLGDLFWIIAWDYDLCRPEFDYIAEQLDALGNLKDYSRPAEGMCKLTTHTGQVIETKSGQDPRKIAGLAPDGIIGCEVALWPYELFLRMRGRVSEKRGWTLSTGSFETSLGWLPEKFTQWQGPNEDEGEAFSLPSWSNYHIFPGGWDDPEIQHLRATYPEKRFMERYAGEPAPPTGRVFDDARVDLHVDSKCVYEKGKPVYLAIDPGYGSAYAILAIQLSNDEDPIINVIDEIYAQRQTHMEVITTAQTRPWWQDVAEVVMDIAGKQHHADKSAEEYWETEGQVRVRSQKVSIQDGIDRSHTFFRINPSTSKPRVRINPRAVGFLSELGLAPSPVEGGGIYSYHTNGDGSIAKELPIDKHNHSSKAFAYFTVYKFGHVKRKSGGLHNYLAPTPTSEHDPFFDPDYEEPARAPRANPVNYLDKGWGRRARIFRS